MVYPITADDECGCSPFNMRLLPEKPVEKKDNVVAFDFGYGGFWRAGEGANSDGEGQGLEMYQKQAHVLQLYQADR